MSKQTAATKKKSTSTETLTLYGPPLTQDLLDASARTVVRYLLAQEDVASEALKFIKHDYATTFDIETPETIDNLVEVLENEMFRDFVENLTASGAIQTAMRQSARKFIRPPQTGHVSEDELAAALVMQPHALDHHGNQTFRDAALFLRVMVHVKKCPRCFDAAAELAKKMISSEGRKGAAL
jgi:hypothetical protein